MGNGRGIGTPVRLVPPGPILVNAGQQGANGLGGNTLRLLTTQQGQQPAVQTPVVYASSAGSTPSNQDMPQGLCDFTKPVLTVSVYSSHSLCI